MYAICVPFQVAPEISESLLVKLLRVGMTAAAAALLALLLLVRAKPGKITELPADPTMTSPRPLALKVTTPLVGTAA